MLVKHNLWPLYKLSDKKLQTYKKGRYEIKDGFIEAESLTEDNYALIQASPIDTKEGDELIGSFVGDVKLGENIIVRDPMAIIFSKIDKVGTEKYIFKYVAQESLFTFECYVTTPTKFNLPSIIINKGDELSDVYLPNINTLPEDKQPLLPPEGNYKEIQAL